MSYVLVLEPHAADATRCEAVVQARGHEAALVASAQDAVKEMARRGLPRLVVVGRTVERAVAFAMLHSLREWRPEAHLPAVVMASFADGSDSFENLGSALERVIDKLHAPAAPVIVTPPPALPLPPAYLGPILEQLEVGILVADGAAKVRWYNRALATMTDPPPSLVGRGVTEWRAHLRSLLGEGGTLVDGDGDLELLRPARQVLRVKRQAVALPDGRGVLESYVDVTKERELQELARVDPLTGLLNRRGGEEALKREVVRARRTGTALGLVIFDVDHFKRINDTCGHAAGDEVLQVVGRVVESSVRGSDVAVRWGGEELLVVLPGAGIDGAKQFAERIRSVVEAFVVEGIGQVTISAGTAELEWGEEMAQTIERADARLYDAKTRGRNRVC